MLQDEINQIKSQAESVMENFQTELNNLRTNRANPSMVEDLEIDYFGSKSPLKQVASVSVADSQTIVIAPWNKDSLVDIEKAINESELNLTANNDGSMIRIVMPSLTEERRQELVKLLGKKTEEARIRIRQIREDVWDDVQKKEKESEITEDDKFKAKEELQELINEYNKKIDELSEKKEKDVMEI
jgi:ribosome recycling factor